MWVIRMEVILKMVTDAFKWRQICSYSYSVKNNKNVGDDETSVFGHSPETN
jgi:hypothetical protein